MAFDDVRMRGFRRRADLSEVVAWVDAWPAPLAGEPVIAVSAAGRVLSDRVVSPVDLPPFPRAAMDGWAVRGADTFGATDVEPLSLRVAGESRPGSFPARFPGPGEALRIRTGAPMPEGADAVLPAEDGEERGDRVAVRGSVPPGRHVGRRGEDVRAGDVVLEKGRRLRPQDVGLLSALGVGSVACVRRPDVAIVVTGDEVLPAGRAPDGARIADADGPMLAALVARDGGLPTVLGPFRDADPGLEAAIVATKADVVLVAGASSVGPEDRVPEIVAGRGRLAFHGIAMRPASPTGVGEVSGRPVFLLPGNPVSCLCAYDLIAGGLVRRLAGGAKGLPYPATKLPLARKVTSELGRVDYLRVRIVEGCVEPLTSRGAGVLTTATGADGFVLVPREVEGWPAGTMVPVHRFDPAHGIC